MADVTVLIDQLGGIVNALKRATAEERAEIYEALAPKLTYEPEPRLARGVPDQARKMTQKSVRGGICPPGLTLRTTRDLAP